jgi:hypothetical protein
MPFRPLCGTGNWYMLAWLVLCAGATLLLVPLFPELDSVLLAVVAASAFRATGWTILTGNIQALEFGLFSATLLAMVRGRGVAAGLLCGLAAFIRIVPLAWCVLPLALGDRKTALRMAAAAAITLAAAHGLFLVAMPAAAHAYWHAWQTGFNGALARETWFGSIYTPALFSFFLSIGRRLGAPYPVAILLQAVSGIALLLLVERDAATDPSRRTALWTAVIAILLVTPRMKPYTPVLAIAPAYVAVSRQSWRGQIAVLAAISVFPAAALAASEAAPERAGLLGYGALISLVMALALLHTRAAPPHPRLTSA